MDFLSGLNPPQQDAVKHVDGPLLILAGAGSGKTRVVTHRICNLICNHGVVPDSILAVTFTNTAAAEMRERIARLLGSLVAPGRGPRLFTFHSFCVRLLRQDGSPLADWRPGFNRQFLIYDADDQIAVLKSLYRHHEIDDKAMPVRQVLSAISSAKNRREGAAELQANSRDPRSKHLAMLYEQYNEALVKANALDFDDLLLEAVKLLHSHQPTRDSWRRRLQFLMIDEYQDTNRTQYDLVRLLSGSHNNVCAVGDEDQSIYSWRGADIRNILDFESDFPNAKTIRLEQNYRSSKTILEAASAVIANNKERKGKWLWTESGSGPRITVYQALDSENEGLFIADEINNLLKANPKWRVAVLYRTNAQSRQIEEALRRYRRPYKIVGGLSFYQRAEIKDVLAYLKLLMVPTDSVGLLRVINTPARGIGRTTIDQLEQHARQHGLTLWAAIGESLEHKLLPGRAEVALRVFRHMIEELMAKLETVPLHAILAEILERTGYRKMLEEDRDPASEGRLENLNELLNAAAEASERQESAATFLDHAALVADADSVDEASQISLLTVHNAKGLEFPLVFVAGLEEGLFPHSRSIDVEAAMEEERRLCYVAMTRAEKQLVLTTAMSRRRYGGGPQEPAVRSRFLAEVPKELCDFQGVQPDIDEVLDIVNDEVDLFSERGFVRETVKWTTDRFKQARTPPPSYSGSGGRSPTQPPRPPANRPPPPPEPPKTPYPGKTYNSVENIAGYFRDRGIAAKGMPARDAASPPRTPPAPPAPPSPSANRPSPVVSMPPPPPRAPIRPPVASSPPPTPFAKPKGKGLREGAVVIHPKYGRGTVVRKEGDGDEAKITVMFPGQGLKKLVAKFAGIKIEE